MNGHSGTVSTLSIKNTPCRRHWWPLQGLFCLKSASEHQKLHKVRQQLENAWADGQRHFSHCYVTQDVHSCCDAILAWQCPTNGVGDKIAWPTNLSGRQKFEQNTIALRVSSTWETALSAGLRPSCGSVPARESTARLHSCLAASTSVTTRLNAFCTWEAPEENSLQVPLHTNDTCLVRLVSLLAGRQT